MKIITSGNLSRVLSLLLPGFLFSACGEDASSPAEPPVRIQVQAAFTGIAAWPVEDHVELGALGKTGSVLAHTTLDAPQDSAMVHIQLESPAEATQIALYLAARTGVPYHILAQQSIPADEDSVAIDFGDVSLVELSRLQAQVFSQCITCHGGSAGEPAAGLILTAGVAKEHLVGVASTFSDKPRVSPGDTADSFLWDVMLDRDLTFEHTATRANRDDDLALVAQWILSLPQ